jgi:hypothetical protein
MGHRDVEKWCRKLESKSFADLFDVTRRLIL